MTALQLLQAAKEDDVAWKTRKKPKFSARAVFVTVMGKDGAHHSTKDGGVKAKMHAFFGRPEERDWEEWLETTADSIDQVPKDERKTSCRMSVGCPACA